MARSSPQLRGAGSPGRTLKTPASRPPPVEKAFQRVLAELIAHGLLLEIDARLPNVCSLVVGEPVGGSWWAHPRSHDIFRVNCALADHPDVLVTKLVSGKITYVHRSLWPAIIATGRGREAPQAGNLSSDARKLLARVEKSPVLPDRALAKAASELEKLLLVSSEQFHTESGSHARCLESWDSWSKRTKFVAPAMTGPQGRHKLEEVLDSLNRRFQGSGRLPWQP